MVAVELRVQGGEDPGFNLDLQATPDALPPVPDRATALDDVLAIHMADVDVTAVPAPDHHVTTTPELPTP